MAESKTRYRKSDVNRIFESGGRHKSGSADIKVWEFFLPYLLNNQLEDDAIIELGMHLEETDVKYMGPWVEAMYAAAKRNPKLLEAVRLRPKLNFHRMVSDSRETSRNLRDSMKLVGETLQKHFTPESACINERLLELIQQLDHPR